MITLIAIVSFVSTSKNNSSKLQLAKDKIILYLSYTRYIAHIDNKYTHDDPEWQKKLWTLKFFNCSSSIGGLYYVVYSDMEGGTAHFKKTDCLKDPTTNKYLYSNSCEEDTLNDKSKYILLTKQYDITSVDISCNTTSTLGQISFGYDGKVYSSLGSNIQEITQPCIITLKDKNNNTTNITIEPKTGYIH